MKNRFYYKNKLASTLVFALCLCPVIILFFFRTPRIIAFFKTTLSSPLPARQQRKKKRVTNQDPFDAECIETASIDSVSKVISAKKGGTLSLKDATLSMAIPPGALDQDQKIRISKMSVLNHEGKTSDYVYDCEPAGLRFKKPVEMDFTVPYKYDPQIIEVVYLDTNSQVWIRDELQSLSNDEKQINARPYQSGRRRIRVIPGKQIQNNTNCGRATFYLESDPGNNYEEHIEDQWKYISRRSRRYRKLMRSHRLGRQDLLKAGRLRAITGARPQIEVFRNDLLTVAMPSKSPEASTGWVRIIRLDQFGQPMGYEVIAKVNDFGPGLQARRCGVIIDLSKAVVERLGLVWGKDFGVTGYMNNTAYMKIKDRSEKTQRYLQVRVEAVIPDFLAQP